MGSTALAPGYGDYPMAEADKRRHQAGAGPDPVDPGQDDQDCWITSSPLATKA